MGLGTDALRFARQYVALVEALQNEGVLEKVAREEARITALIMMFRDGEDGNGQACPLCGQCKEENSC